MGSVTDATPYRTRSPATAPQAETSGIVGFQPLRTDFEGRCCNEPSESSGKWSIRAGSAGFKGRGPGRYNVAVELTEKQRRHLKGLAHHLDPVIRVGNAGVSPSVVAETRRALNDHELIKVRVAGVDRDERNAAMELLAGECDAALVARVGHVAILYRRHPERPRILLPAAASA